MKESPNGKYTETYQNYFIGWSNKPPYFVLKNCDILLFLLKIVLSESSEEG